MANSPLAFPRGTHWGQFLAGCLYHFPLRAPCMRFIRVSPLVGKPSPLGRPQSQAPWSWRRVSLRWAADCPAAHSEQPAVNWPLGTSHQEPRGWKRRRLSVSKLGQTRGAGPQGSPEQVSEGHWNRRTGVKRDPEVGEEAETPARRGRGAGNCSAETDREGVPEGPSPRRQTSDKKFQTLTASFQEPEMEKKTKRFHYLCLFFFLRKKSS